MRTLCKHGIGGHFLPARRTGTSESLPATEWKIYSILSKRFFRPIYYTTFIICMCMPPPPPLPPYPTPLSPPPPLYPPTPPYATTRRKTRRCYLPTRTTPSSLINRLPITRDTYGGCKCLQHNRADSFNN